MTPWSPVAARQRVDVVDVARRARLSDGRLGSSESDPRIQEESPLPIDVVASARYAHYSAGNL
jgi:hypothetical protein